MMIEVVIFWYRAWRSVSGEWTLMSKVIFDLAGVVMLVIDEDEDVWCYFVLFLFYLGKEPIYTRILMLSNQFFFSQSYLS